MLEEGRVCGRICRYIYSPGTFASGRCARVEAAFTCPSATFGKDWEGQTKVKATDEIKGNLFVGDPHVDAIWSGVS